MTDYEDLYQRMQLALQEIQVELQMSSDTDDICERNVDNAFRVACEALELAEAARQPETEMLWAAVGRLDERIDDLTYLITGDDR